MSDRHEEPLDDLLHRWAAARESSDEHLSQLCDATLARLKPLRFVDLVEIAPRRATHWRLYGGMAAMAAAALFALFLSSSRRVGVNEHMSMRGRPGGQAPTPGEGTSAPTVIDDVPEAARLDELQLARKAKLLKVLQETFPDDLVWVSETEGEIHIGLRPGAAPSAGDERAPTELAVRIVVAARRSDQPTWKTLCSADVLTEPQELVEVPLDSKGGGRLAVWTCLLPDGLVAVDSDISWPAARGLHASASTVQREGVPCRTDSSTADGWEYRVFQTVGRLPTNSAAPPPAAQRRRAS